MTSGSHFYCLITVTIDYHIPINDTPFELHVFWPSDTEHYIKLTFSESV